MAKKKIRLSQKIYNAMERSLSYSTHQLVPVGIVGTFFFPFIYFIWAIYFPEVYENLWMRIVGALLCAGLIVHAYWPRKLRKYMPFYWYFTMFYCLPFYFFFILLKNNAAFITLMDFLIVIFLLILLVDWISFIVIQTLGVLAAIIVYLIATPNPSWPPEELIGYSAAYIFVIIAGLIFNYKTALLHQHRLEGMGSITENVAHELRTPLLGIKGGIEGLKKYFPLLMQTYHLAHEKGLEVPKIRKQHIVNILPALDRMEGETHFANTIIDMLLMNVGKNTKMSTESFQIYSIKNTVEIALKRYPFDSAEAKEKIHLNKDQDFNYWGSDILLVHVLFNLLKNALHFIVKAEKGEIFIWFELGEKYNYLHFKDTGLGIASNVLAKIFDRFFTTTLTGTGIGLSYCKLVMQSFEGDITCISEEEKYAEFILAFPTMVRQ